MRANGGKTRGEVRVWRCAGILPPGSDSPPGPAPAGDADPAPKQNPKTSLLADFRRCLPRHRGPLFLGFQFWSNSEGNHSMRGPNPFN